MTTKNIKQNDSVSEIAALPADLQLLMHDSKTDFRFTVAMTKLNEEHSCWADMERDQMTSKTMGNLAELARIVESAGITSLVPAVTKCYTLTPMLANEINLIGGHIIDVKSFIGKSTVITGALLKGIFLAAAVSHWIKGDLLAPSTKDFCEQLNKDSTRKITVSIALIKELTGSVEVPCSLSDSEICRMNHFAFGLLGGLKLAKLCVGRAIIRLPNEAPAAVCNLGSRAAASSGGMAITKPNTKKIAPAVDAGFDNDPEFLMMVENFRLRKLKLARAEQIAAMEYAAEEEAAASARQKSAGLRPKSTGQKITKLRSGSASSTNSHVVDNANFSDGDENQNEFPRTDSERSEY